MRCYTISVSGVSGVPAWAGVLGMRVNQIATIRGADWVPAVEWVTRLRFAPDAVYLLAPVSRSR